MVCACVRLVKKHQDQEAPSILIFESEALEENFSVIKAEYEAYRQKLANRKDWDDSDTTPGLGPASVNYIVQYMDWGRTIKNMCWIGKLLDRLHLQGYSFIPQNVAGLGWFVYLLQMKHSIAWVSTNK